MGQVGKRKRLSELCQLQVFYQAARRLRERIYYQLRPRKRDRNREGNLEIEMARVCYRNTNAAE